jgi:2-oxoglutarate dehydrogenase E2 component (dihydrolipoamide succinyltransferase)
MLEIKIPTVGESITEVTLSQWLKKDGDQVAQDEVICEIESDKASFELNAEQPGILHTKANEGDTVAVGSVIATIDTSAAAQAKNEKPAPKPEEKEQVQPVQTEKPAQAEPQPEKQVSAEKQSYASGTPSPAAEKILDEKNIAPAEVKGTGRDGRITKNDAVQAKTKTTETPEKEVPFQETEAPKPTPQKQAPQNVQPQQVQNEGAGRNIRREKMSTLRKTIAKRLVEAKNLTAMLTTFNEIDMSAVMEMRKKYKDAFKDKYGIGLGFMSLFTRAACESLKEFPAVNAMIDENELVYHDYVDVGVAVSTPRGLVVPVIKNAESMSLADIEKAIADLAVRARDNKLSIDEMTGGTFTITNGGVFGSLMSTPIINAPQSAILGMHNIVDRPVAVNGEVVIRPMMYVALSYDHRVIDGRESVSFLLKIKQYIEDPARMLLEV